MESGIALDSLMILVSYLGAEVEIIVADHYEYVNEEGNLAGSIAMVSFMLYYSCYDCFHVISSRCGMGWPTCPSTTH